MTLLSKHFQFLVKHDIFSSNRIERSLFPEPLESTDILIPDFNIILDFATALSENLWEVTAAYRIQIIKMKLWKAGVTVSLCNLSR